MHLVHAVGAVNHEDEGAPVEFLELHSSTLQRLGCMSSRMVPQVNRGPPGLGVPNATTRGHMAAHLRAAGWPGGAPIPASQHVIRQAGRQAGGRAGGQAHQSVVPG